MIRDGENGLLADFFDADALARKALAVLKDPAAFRPLGRAAEAMVRDRYSLETVLPQMVGVYEEAGRMSVNA
jgi:glycosyltransferase involved in cell wall biosynthesis